MLSTSYRHLYRKCYTRCLKLHVSQSIKLYCYAPSRYMSHSHSNAFNQMSLHHAFLKGFQYGSIRREMKCLPFQSCSFWSLSELSQHFSVKAASPEDITETSSSSSSSSSEATSNASVTSNEIGIEYIPPPPVPPEVLEPQINALGELTFSSQGLGGWTPAGLLENVLEFLHVDLGLPWWSAIMALTLVLRSLLTPLVIVSQKNTAKMTNYMPQLQVLQMKMSEARQSGNVLEASRYAHELNSFMKEKQLKPMQSIFLPLCQAPIFISMFVALRSCANLPLESMKSGGMFWFTDLTLVDPYYVLPLITSITMYITIKVGAEGANLSMSQNAHIMKYVLRLIPLFLFPFTINFPTAILCYWVSTNVFSLGQVFLLRMPSVRNYFKIEQAVHHDPSSMPRKDKGFIEGIKESYRNMKITSELEGRHNFDEMQFKKAGTGPAVRTYRYDPTKYKQK